jgi:hypothetical protein
VSSNATYPNVQLPVKLELIAFNLNPVLLRLYALTEVTALSELTVTLTTLGAFFIFLAKATDVVSVLVPPSTRVILPP